MARNNHKGGGFKVKRKPAAPPPSTTQKIKGESQNEEPNTNTTTPTDIVQYQSYDKNTSAEVTMAVNSTSTSGEFVTLVPSAAEPDSPPSKSSKKKKKKASNKISKVTEGSTESVTITQIEKPPTEYPEIFNIVCDPNLTAEAKSEALGAELLRSREQAFAEQATKAKLIEQVERLEKNGEDYQRLADRAMQTVDGAQSTLRAQRETIKRLEEECEKEKNQRIILETEKRLVAEVGEKSTATKTPKEEKVLKVEAEATLEKLKTEYENILKEKYDDFEEMKKKLEAAESQIKQLEAEAKERMNELKAKAKEDNEAAIEKSNVQHKAAMSALEEEKDDQNTKLLGDIVRIAVSAHKEKCDMESAFEREKATLVAEAEQKISAALRIQWLVFAGLSFFATGLLLLFGPSCCNLLYQFVASHFSTTTTLIASISRTIMQFGYEFCHQNDPPTSIHNIVSLSAFTRLESIIAPMCYENFSVTPDIVLDPFPNCGLNIICWITRGCEWLDFV